jgi:prephenate dehydrogenase
MTTLNVGILGLDRVGTSFGLALKQYAATHGKYTFDITGYDVKSANEKAAQKARAIDRIEKSPAAAVRDRQIVFMNMPYDEVRPAYRNFKNDLREGVVILDGSPLKTPSHQWAKELLGDDHHVIGFTPLPASRFLENTGMSAEEATADYFEGAACLVVPSVDSVPEAVDLAYNAAYLVGGKPRFVDPHDYDQLLSLTEQLPRLLGITLLYNLLQSESWKDIGYFTGSAFALATRVLRHEHPDSLREQFYGNREVLAQSLDQMIERLGEVRDVLRSNDKDALEAFLVKSSENYEKWLNTRQQNDWDKDAQPREEGSGMLGMFVGDRLAKRIQGKK